MIWEVRKRFKHKGYELKMWHNIDVSGRRVYVVTLESDPYEPIRGVYTQKEALADCMQMIAEREAMGAIFKRAGV